MASSLSVREYFSGRSILISGGTGFMGKVMIEKLLYSIPEIDTIYILMRPKRGKSVQQRISDILKLPIFDRIRKENPIVLKKLKPIQGDVLFDDLGISSVDLDMIKNEISIIYHFAATLKLEAPLKDNVNMNTTGTLRILKIAKQVKNLNLFVHLSTAFCYPDYEFLGETTHPPTVSPYDVIRLCEWLDDKQLAILTPSLLGIHPNCYTYSKRLAESLVEEAYSEIPCVIARPSIVIPSVTEPVPGWVDSLNGPVGVMVGAGKGVIRTMLCNGKLVGQIIPVDSAINGVICLTVEEGSKKEKPVNIPVYNLNAANQQPTTWGQVLDNARVIGREAPLAWPLWYPNGDMTTNHIAHHIKCFFYHWIPAYFIDFMLFLVGQKRFMCRVQRKVSQGLEVLQYFTMRKWEFGSTNYEELEKKLSKKEQQVFPMNIEKHDINQYLRTCIEGGRLYCLNEDPARIPLNRIHHNVLFVLDLILKVLLVLLILSLMASWFTPVKQVFSYGGAVVRHLPLLGTAVFNE